MIDLDARRSEANGDPVVVRFGGKEWELPAELPITVPELLAEGHFRAAVEELFGEDADHVLDIRPPLSIDDLKALVEGYSIRLGEASSSSAS